MDYLSERLHRASRTRARGDGRAPVAREQRERILRATEKLVGEQGYEKATIEGIAKAARVSTITFYEHFSTKEQCFLAAFDRAWSESWAQVATAVPAGAGWSEQVDAALRALLELIAADPGRARMCLIDTQKAGPAVRARYEAALDRVVPHLRRGRELAPGGAEFPEVLEEATVGGLAWILRQRLEAGNVEEVEQLLPKMAEVVFAPYLEDGSPVAVGAGEEG